jgi:peptidoglycan-N-acetylglucosamine deacetylase
MATTQTRAVLGRVRRKGCAAFADGRAAALNCACSARFHTDKGCVALTFDDGPNPEFTLPLLDLLGALEVTATFFCVGANVAKHPAICRAIEAAGHTVGSHSMTHRHPARLSAREVTADYRLGRDVIEDTLGHAVPLFRPPHGYLSVASAFMLRREGFEPWIWTIDPQDWVPGAQTDDLVNTAGRAGSSDVVLLHDWIEEPLAPAALDRSATLVAVPRVVEAVRSRGLRFATVSGRSS